MSINIILVRFLNQALRYGSVKFQYFSLENSIPKKKKKKNHQRKKTAITQHGSKSKPIGRMIDKFH